MGLESATYISDLNSSNPAAGDAVSAGDDHLRLIKAAVKATFPNITGAVTPTHTELNYVDGVTSAIQTQLDAKAPLASPTFTGTPSLPTGTTAVTQSANDNSTKLATTAYADAAASTALPGAWKLIKSSATGTGATVDFINGSGGVVINSTYDVYMLELINVVPGTNAVTLALRTSTDATNFDSGAGNYLWVRNQLNSSNGTPASTSASSAGDTEIELFGSVPIAGSTPPGGVSAQIFLFAPAAAQALRIQWQASYCSSGGGVVDIAIGAGTRYTAADVDGIRFFWSSGNFASGTINLYGRVK